MPCPRRLLALLTLLVSTQLTAGMSSSVEGLFETNLSEPYFVVSLLKPHRVYSTSAVNGGETNAVTFLVNHQSMKPDDSAQMARILAMGKNAYHQEVADKLQLPPEQMVLMGTAVAMKNLAHEQHCFEALCVDAFVTAGVRTNALRAGDPTRWYETETGNKRIEASAVDTATHDFIGTINTIVLVNHPLQAGTQVKVAMLAVEAKSAALAELATPSTASQYLATGTGTDQITIASPLSMENRQPLRSASGHLKLGELVGISVKAATLAALENNGPISPTVEYALGRFGLTQQTLLASMKAYLGEDAYLAAEENLETIIHNSRLVAAAFAYATLLDRIELVGQQDSEKSESLRDQAANAAVAISGKPQLWAHFREKIEISEAKPEHSFAQAVALGWLAKGASP